MRRGRLWCVSAAMAGALVGVVPVASSAQPRSRVSSKSSAFEFGLIGDQAATGEPSSPAGLVEAMNARSLAFALHDGGIGDPPAGCTDDVYRKTRDVFDTFDTPLIYTPGEAEWSDCASGGFDPGERLASLRRVFFSTDQSRGRRTLPLERQRPRYPENARWTSGPLTFATLHVVGGHDGQDQGAEGDGAFAARRAAALAWLNQTFDVATRSGSAGVVLVWHADPLFRQDVAAYNNLRGALRARTMAWGKPVLLVHGDRGSFRIDKPMADDSGRRVDNFTRVQTFGPAEPHWVRITVDPSDPELFAFHIERVSTEGPAQGTGCRDGDPLANVRSPGRLRVLSACERPTGVVTSAKRMTDGDWHITLRPDPESKWFLNDVNRNELGGALIVEIVPADQPGCRKGERIRDDRGTCTGAHIGPPNPGTYVEVTGPWVYDRNHGHLEIHPIWKIDATPSNNHN